MHFLDVLAEQRIAEAIAAGEFDDLPGTGKPLVLDDDALVPEELRVAHRILKNAGFLPPEMATRREIADLKELLRHAADEPSRRRATARLALLDAKLDLDGRALTMEPEYRERIAERLGR